MLQLVNTEMLSLAAYIEETKASIGDEIRRHLRRYSSLSSAFADERSELYGMMESHALRGKAFRGILAVLGYELFAGATGSRHTEALSLAAAMELFQSGLLVHDDIMDRDDVRRGQPTMHRLLEKFAREDHEKRGSDQHRTDGEADTDFARMGESMGICIGDIYYFIAWEIVSSISAALAPLAGKELADVCLAQIRDVRYGLLREMPKLDSIWEVYAHKTARYTIYLPLAAGSLLAGQVKALPFIEKLGLDLGVAFQLKDDWLGLFGETDQIGKPSGSDIREAKKTPYMVLLYESLAPEEKSEFGSIFGNSQIGKHEIERIREMVITHGIDKTLDKTYEAYATGARKAILDLERNIPCLDEHRLSLLKEFTEYSLTRDR